MELSKEERQLLFIELHFVRLESGDRLESLHESDSLVHAGKREDPSLNQFVLLLGR